MSSHAEHAVRDNAVAKVVDCNNQVIVVSDEKVVVDLVVEVTHVHHVLQVVD